MMYSYCRPSALTTATLLESHQLVYTRMKRQPIWKELNLPPPAKKPSSAAAASDPARQEAAQRTLRSTCIRTLLAALTTPNPSSTADKLEDAISSAGRTAGGHNSIEPDPGGIASANKLSELAEAIEHELFNRHSGAAGQDYKTAARTLIAGLKRNSDLRVRVLSGALTPRQLVRLDARQLATAEQQRAYAELQEVQTRRVTLVDPLESAAASTSDYHCERCGGRACTYLDTGRRDIGKCETWGSKDGARTSRLVTCLGCGNRWEVDDV